MNKGVKMQLAVCTSVVGGLCTMAITSHQQWRKKTEKKLQHTAVNGNAMSAYKILAENKYDVLGQLKSKKLAPSFNSNAGLETLAYDYNIRGWMLEMNRSYLSTNGQSGSTKFGFELGYDKTTNKSNQVFIGIGLFNGNITGMLWKSDGG